MSPDNKLDSSNKGTKKREKSKIFSSLIYFRFNGFFFLFLSFVSQSSICWFLRFLHLFYLHFIHNNIFFCFSNCFKRKVSEWDNQRITVMAFYWPESKYFYKYIYIFCIHHKPWREENLKSWSLNNENSFLRKFGIGW